MLSDVTFVLICECCGHYERNEKEKTMELVNHKETEFNRLGSAELGKQIHQIKNTHHRPYIMTVAETENEDGETEVDIHVPDWAEGGYRDPPEYTEMIL